MSQLIKIIKNIKTEIDLTPIEEIIDNYKQILIKRKNFQDRTHIDYHLEILERLKKLSLEQEDYLINELISLTNHYADLNQTFLDNPLKQAKKIQSYKNLLN